MHRRPAGGEVVHSEYADDVARTVTREHGKTLDESRSSVRRAIDNVDNALAIPQLMQGQSLEDIAHGIDCHTVRQPLGVFAAITPFNFPAMVPMWFMPYAVACGNTFIVKPSERVPLSQVRIFELLHDAGFPEGVVNLVNGAKDAVDAILDHPGIAGVSFVGSSPVAPDARARYDAFAAAIRKIGPEFCILSTDLGQMGNPLPVDGFGVFLAAMRERGFTEQEIGLMSRDNPARLLGLR